MIQIYTDGSCGKSDGGWACIIITGDRHELITGYASNTTCNRMELDGFINGLKHVPPKSCVEIVSDSEYCVKGFNSWMHKWEKNNWMRTAEDETKNKEYWRQLIVLKKIRSCQARCIKGHVDSVDIPHVLNDLCDRAATLSRKEKVRIFIESNSLEELIKQYDERHPRPIKSRKRSKASTGNGNHDAA